MTVALTVGVAAAIITFLLLVRHETRPDVIPVLTAMVGAAAAFLVNPAANVIDTRTVIAIVAVAAVVDVQVMRIPNITAGAAAVIAVGGWVHVGAPLAPILVAAGVGGFLLVMFLIDGIGGGDVKMLPPLVLAVATPFPDPGSAILVGSMLTAAVFTVALVTHALSGARRRERSPLAPAMLIAGLGSLTFM